MTMRNSRLLQERRDKSAFLEQKKFGSENLRVVSRGFFVTV
jgi:hypothetical protein